MQEQNRHIRTKKKKTGKERENIHTIKEQKKNWKVIEKEKATAWDRHRKHNIRSRTVKTGAGRDKTKEHKFRTAG